MSFQVPSMNSARDSFLFIKCVSGCRGIVSYQGRNGYEQVFNGILSEKCLAQKMPCKTSKLGIIA